MTSDDETVTSMFANKYGMGFKFKLDIDSLIWNLLDRPRNTRLDKILTHKNSTIKLSYLEYTFKRK